MIKTEDNYHRLSQASVALIGTVRDDAREDGANVVLTIYRQEGGDNTSSMATYLTKDEALALAHKLLRGALYDEAEDESWWVKGVRFAKGA